MNKSKLIFLSLIALSVAMVSACKSEPAFKVEGAQDIGSVNIPGSYVYNSANDTYTLNAAGLNLWERKDAFYFVWMKVSGDFEISGDIAFEGEGVNPHRKLGFMARESLEPGSRYADIAIHGEGLTSIQYRKETDGVTAEVTSKDWGPTSITFKRVGDVFYYNDVQLELALPEECYLGLFMCSHEADVSETGYISNVKLVK